MVAGPGDVIASPLSLPVLPRFSTATSREHPSGAGFRNAGFKSAGFSSAAFRNAGFSSAGFISARTTEPRIS